MYHMSFRIRCVRHTIWACMRLNTQGHIHICIQYSVFRVRCTLNGMRHGACYQINKKYVASIIIIIIPSLITIQNNTKISIQRDPCVVHSYIHIQSHRLHSRAMFTIASAFSLYAWLKKIKK